jgi:SNF2 family DNA or RNA helicase
LDRAWNPSQNRQAEDRLHRIGQKNAVHVVDIIARNTVDGGHLQQIRLKWEWLKVLLGDQVEPSIYTEVLSA